MRFALTHKLTSYLMALAAVASLLFSPEISLTTSALALLGIGASFFAEPPRYPLERLTLAWNIATLLVFALLVAQVVFGGESLITAGVRFLLVVLVNKLFNRRRSKDYQQIYVVSFLVLVAATTLNTSLSYAVCFVAFIVFATWSLILFHLRREMEDNYLLKHSEASAQSEKVEVNRILNSRRIIGGSFLAGTSLISLGVIIGAGAIFAFFPRIGFGLFAAHKRRAMTMAGFSERVQLGQHGAIRDNPQVVMRVVLGPAGKPQKKAPAGTLRWRGSVYDHYARGSWTHGPEISGRPAPVYPQRGLYVMNYAPGLPDRPDATALRKTLLRQQVYLEPLASSVIFALDRPVALEVPRRKLSNRLLFTPRRGPLGELRASRRRTAGVLYVAYSKPFSHAPATLRRARPLKTARWAPFLQIPREMPQRVRALARRITRGKPTIYDKVLAVQRYLQAKHRYSLLLEHKKGREPIDEFLFETQKGHCEYFASSMAILLRVVGIHTRHVNGFSGGRWNDYGNYLAVRQGDAHAWTEVLFSNVGWVTFDPTPPRSQVAASKGGVVRALEQMVDAVRLRWLNYVVEYDISKQLTLLSRIKSLVRGTAPAKRKGSFWARNRRLLLFAGGLALAIALLYGLRRWRRRLRIRPGGKRRSRRAEHPATRAYERALAALAKAALAKEPGATPGEFAQRLQAAGHPCAALVTRLTHCYYASRFDAEAAVEDDELSQLVSQLRRELRATTARGS